MRGPIWLAALATAAAIVAFVGLAAAQPAESFYQVTVDLIDGTKVEGKLPLAQAACELTVAGGQKVKVTPDTPKSGGVGLRIDRADDGYVIRTDARTILAQAIWDKLVLDGAEAPAARLKSARYVYQKPGER